MWIENQEMKNKDYCQKKASMCIIHYIIWNAFFLKVNNITMLINPLLGCTEISSKCADIKCLDELL